MIMIHLHCGDLGGDQFPTHDLEKSEKMRQPSPPNNLSYSNAPAHDPPHPTPHTHTIYIHSTTSVVLISLFQLFLSLVIVGFSCL